MLHLSQYPLAFSPFFYSYYLLTLFFNKESEHLKFVDQIFNQGFLYSLNKFNLENQKSSQSFRSSFAHQKRKSKYRFTSLYAATAAQPKKPTPILKVHKIENFFWLRFWNLRSFFVSYIKILRFYKKIFLIGPLLGEVRFFCVVLGRRMKKNFELGKDFYFYFLQLLTINMTQY